MFLDSAAGRGVRSAFRQAKAAEKRGEWRKALEHHQGGAQTLMTFLTQNPAHRMCLQPHLELLFSAVFAARKRLVAWQEDTAERHAEVQAEQQRWQAEVVSASAKSRKTRREARRDEAFEPEPEPQARALEQKESEPTLLGVKSGEDVGGDGDGSKSGEDVGGDGDGSTCFAEALFAKAARVERDDPRLALDMLQEGIRCTLAALEARSGSADDTTADRLNRTLQRLFSRAFELREKLAGLEHD